MRKLFQGLGRGLKALLQLLLRGLILLFFRPRVTWASPAARQALEKPCVLISNHVRGLDGAVIFTALHRRDLVGLVALDWYEKNPVLHFFLSCLPVLPVDRERPALGWLRESRRLLRDGKSIYLCPEGKCHRDKAIRPFKPGFATLAAAARVPVVPVYHNGTYHWLFGRRFRMMVGEPLTIVPAPEGLDSGVLQEEAEAARRAVRALEFTLTGTNREEETSP